MLGYFRRGRGKEPISPRYSRMGGRLKNVRTEISGERKIETKETHSCRSRGIVGPKTVLFFLEKELGDSIIGPIMSLAPGCIWIVLFL